MEHKRRKVDYAMVRGDEAGIPLADLGPTGEVFLHPGGYSTHLGSIVEDERLNGGKPSYVPLLSEHQRGIGWLLGGSTPKPQQYDIAIEDAIRRGDAPSYDSIDAALADEQRQHDAKEGRGYPRLRDLGFVR